MKIRISNTFILVENMASMNKWNERKVLLKNVLLPRGHKLVIILPPQVQPWQLAIASRQPLPWVEGRRGPVTPL